MCDYIITISGAVFVCYNFNEKLLKKVVRKKVTKVLM